MPSASHKSEEGARTRQVTSGLTFYTPLAFLLAPILLLLYIFYVLCKFSPSSACQASENVRTNVASNPFGAQGLKEVKGKEIYSDFT